MSKEELFNLAILASEIKAPIGVALSSIELIEKMIEPRCEVYDNALKDLFNISISNIHKSLRISYNIIDLNRLTNKDFHLQISPQNITELLNKNLKTVERFLSFRNVKFDFICCVPDVLIACIDESALSRILLNLISNSIKHLPKENGKIIVKLELEDGYVIISVTDNGSGIKKDKLQHIFKPYWHDESEDSRDKYSIGLGLYIVESLLKLHSGGITVSSEPYMQTAFKVHIPQKNYLTNNGILNSTSAFSNTERFEELMKRELIDCF